MTRKASAWDREFRNKQYDKNEHGNFERNLVFVAMPFATEMDKVYTAIKKECKKQGLKAVRADEKPGGVLIIREITKLIEKAEYIICDLSLERPNVYYELGYAHRAGNDGLCTFLVANTSTEIHFDITPLNIEKYSSIKELKKLISTNFKAMVKKDRKNRN